MSMGGPQMNPANADIDVSNNSNIFMSSTKKLQIIPKFLA